MSKIKNTSSLLVTLFALALFVPQISHADYISVPDGNSLIFNNSITSVAATSTGTYVSGQFTQTGSVYTGTVAPFSTATGMASSTRALVVGNVSAMVLDHSGGYYIGGSITQVGTSTRTRLAHILANGTLDPNFSPTADNIVNAMALSPDGSTLYVGGNFLFINGVSYNRLVAIRTSDGVAIASTTFNPNPSAAITAMSISPDGNTLYVGGSFTTIGGGSYNRLAAIKTSDGTASTTFNPNMSSTVNAMALTPDGSTLYVGGAFTTVGGVTYNRLAAIKTSNGVASTTFNPNVGSTVNAMALTNDGSTLYIGGAFTTVGVGTYNRIAAVRTADGSVVSNFAPSINNTVKAMAVSPDGSAVYAGGQFTAVGTSSASTTYNYFVKLNTSDGSVVTSFVPYLSSVVQSLVMSSDGLTIYTGGGFTFSNGASNKYLLHILPDGTVDPVFNPQLASAGSGNLFLSPDGSVLYVTNTSFTSGGTTYSTLVALNPTTGAVITSFTPAIGSGSVNSLSFSSDGSTIYIGGLFSTIGGVTYNCVAALRASDGSVISSFNPNILPNSVNSVVLSPDGSKLYIGGWFDTVGGNAYKNLVAVNTSDGSYIPAFHPDPNSSSSDSIHTMAISPDGNTLYVGGTFTTIGGGSYNRIAAIKTSDGTASTTFNPNIDNLVGKIVMSPDGKRLYVGGTFVTVGGAGYHHLAILNTSDGSPVTTFNPDLGTTTNMAVNSIALTSSKIFVGGSFISVNGDGSKAYYTAFSSTSVLPSKTFSSLSSGGASDTYTLVLTAVPTSTVTINVAPVSGANITVSPSTLNFTPSNWNIPQTLTITPGTFIGTANDIITHTVVSTDPNYGGVFVPSLSVSLTGPNPVAPVSSGSRVSLSTLTKILAPGTTTDAYIKSLVEAPASSTPEPVANTGSISSGSFTRYLNVGSVGTDVKLLQKYLNSIGFTIDKSGPGSPNNETTVFGSKTKAALVKFQAVNKITPASGYFGPKTSAYVKSKL